MKKKVTKKVTAHQVAARFRETGRRLRQLQALVTKKAAPRRTRSAAYKSGLSGYLVVWHHTMDDVPVGLFADEEEAFKFAQKCSRSRAYKVTDRLGIDCSTPVCFSVVHFDGGNAVDNFVIARKDDAV